MFDFLKDMPSTFEPDFSIVCKEAILYYRLEINRAQEELVELRLKLEAELELAELERTKQDLQENP